MEIKFVKMNPTQNMTILVESDIAPEKRIEIGSKLMRHDSVAAEQVGFITKPNSPEAWARLDMLAGEFCGNASMSLAVFLAMERNIREEQIIPLEISGMDGILECLVQPKGEHFYCTVKMPTPKAIQQKKLFFDGESYNLWVADMNGITHVIVPTHMIQGDIKAFAEKAVKEWQKLFSVDAFGILLYDYEYSTMIPLIYIEPADSLVWENGCGSGSAAMGSCFTVEKAQNMSLTVQQPGGSITVSTIYKDSSVQEVNITGKVSISARGIAYL